LGDFTNNSYVDDWDKDKLLKFVDETFTKDIIIAKNWISNIALDQSLSLGSWTLMILAQKTA